MKSLVFILVVLASGASAGLVQGTVNFVLVEPYLDRAIGIENQGLFDSGQKKDTPQFRAEYEGYRSWQKGGQVLAGVILGMSVGSLFGIVFALSQNSLPGGNNVKKATVLAGIMWCTIYLVPFLKYPANPPTAGGGETVVLRITLYLLLVAISGLGALGFYRLSKKFQGSKKLVVLAGYCALVSVVFFTMPENPDAVNVPPDLLSGFRMMSMIGVASFWASIGVILGIFWNRFISCKKTAPYYN